MKEPKYKSLYTCPEWPNPHDILENTGNKWVAAREWGLQRKADLKESSMQVWEVTELAEIMNVKVHQVFVKTQMPSIRDLIAHECKQNQFKLIFTK